MLTILQAIILGIVQGVTEWLPVSSSGHLVIVQQFFGLEVPVFFDILLHVGTLGVIFVFFRKDILELIKAIIHRDFQSEYGRLFIFILLGLSRLPLFRANFSLVFLRKERVGKENVFSLKNTFNIYSHIHTWFH